MILRSHAKINLSIQLLGRRSDGYHEIVTLMETVDLADDVQITTQETGTTVTCTDPAIPTDRRNLVTKAADLVRKRYGLGDQGVRINIVKRIPVAAGLAGGSGNAAMTLHGLNKIWALELQKESLMRLAADLGSDVPFCLYGGAAVASGRGEKVEWLKESGPRHYVLVSPPLAVSSEWAYGRWKLGLTKDVQGINLISSVMQTGDAEKLATCLRNDLEPGVRAAFPEVRRARRLLEDAGLEGILMSGSGPTVFGLVPDRSTAERIKSDLQKKVESSWRVFAVSSISRQDTGN